MDGLHVGGRVPLALEQGCPGDTFLGRLDGGDEGAQTVDLHGVALRQELCDAARHLHEHALDDVSAVDRVVLGHVLAEAAQRDGLLLDGLGVVLAVARIVRIDVLANVDFKLWIFYCHNLILLFLFLVMLDYFLRRTASGRRLPPLCDQHHLPPAHCFQFFLNHVAKVIKNFDTTKYFINFFQKFFKIMLQAAF